MAQERALRSGERSTAVKQWQYFLYGRGYIKVIADGQFGPQTLAATIDFQKKQGLSGDGVVGNLTYMKAMQGGFQLVRDVKDNLKTGPNWPHLPDFKALKPAEVQRLFGKIEFLVNPDGTVKITNNWQRENMVSVKIPQLEGKPNYPNRKSFNFHRKAAPQFVKLFAEWDKAGLADRILTFDGDFNARFIKSDGLPKVLSNHSFGTGIDINAEWNRLGATPALIGQKGCVRELVPIANRLGFYWGGHFSRQDGMHFEIARVI